MLTRSTLALALLSSQPFLVCSPQVKEAQTGSGSTTSDTSTSTTDSSSTTVDATTTDSTTTTTTGPAMCGNGEQEMGEDCDDGNQSNEDACLNNCAAASCGDDFVQAGVEECDDGDTIDTNACTAGCKNAICGDGITLAGTEECDDGNDVDTDDCTNDCKLPVCGDGVMQGSEACDNGANNVAPESALPTDCTTACAFACGDGTKSSGEECDDGGTAPVDGCSAECGHEYIMFATKDVYPADFGGVAAADTICQGAADGKFVGTYVAWLSVSGDAASVDLPQDKPLVRTDGQPIVATSSDLTKEVEDVLMNEINRDEDGNVVNGYAWTGTGPTGSWSGGDCTIWTTANGFAADVGNLASKKSTWTKDPGPVPQAQLFCDSQNHLYCFRKLEP